jgi:hypothetical protein
MLGNLVNMMFMLIYTIGNIILYMLKYESALSCIKPDDASSLIHFTSHKSRLLQVRPPSLVEG